MNIFYIDKCPYRAAQMLHDVHLRKMIVETAQMLSMAHRILDGTHRVDTSGKRKKQVWDHPVESLYKVSHPNHPSTKWVRANNKTYEWAWDHFYAMCLEYRQRFKKPHLTEIKLLDVLRFPPKNISDGDFFDPPLAISPIQYHDTDHMIAYRKYYLGEKLEWSQRGKPVYAKWTNQIVPKFIQEKNVHVGT